MNVALHNMTKRYGALVAVDNCSLQIEDGELITLLGPSGCGKTTLLRMVAGLVEADGGRLFFADKEMTNASAQNRKAAMVFQHYALFPNLNVAENVAFGLKAGGMKREEISRKVGLALERVDLGALGNRRVDELSGGQRQRVALARALVVEPNVLLLDEPLSNLDEKLRQSMRRNIRALQQELGMTTLYVTHDQQEAMAISDRIAVMNHGVIQQIGRPDEIYNAPQNAFVANFIGHANILNATVLSCNSTTCRILLFDRERLVKKPSSFMGGSYLKVMIRPEAVHFSETGILASIQWIEHLGSFVRYTLKCNDVDLIADRVNSLSTKYEQIGDCVQIDFEDISLVVLE